MRIELVQKALNLGNRIEAALEKGSNYQMSEVDELMELTEQLEDDEVDALLALKMGNVIMVIIDNREFHQN